MLDVVAQVRRHLADIPELIIEASHYLTPGTAPKDPDARHATSIYKIPIVAEIADLVDGRDKKLDDVADNRGGFIKPTGESGAEWQWPDGEGRIVEESRQRRIGVLPTLGLWVSVVHPELEDLGHNPRECCPPRNHTLMGESSWLSEYAEPIIELHPDFPRDIEQLWLELRKACRIRKTYQPRCPQCNNHIQGVYGNVDDAAPAWWRCTGCGRTWVHDAEIQRLAKTQPRMTLRQIASLLQLSLTTLRRWALEGRFQPDSRGRFDLEHVTRAAEKAGRISA